MFRNKFLLLLVLTVFFKQLIWVGFIPLWHFPDEQAHFGQVAYSIEKQTKYSKENTTKEILLSERILQTERDWAGNNKFTYHPEYNLPYTDNYFGRQEEEINTFPENQRKIMVKSESTVYPPLYYYPLTIIYKLFYDQNIFVRVFTARLFNMAYILLMIPVTLGIFKLVFKDNNLSISGTILVTFHPMFSYTLAGINSDNLYNLLFTIGIYASLLLLNGGLKIKYLLFALIILLLTIKTKPQGYILGVVYLFPLIYLFLRKKSLRLYLPFLSIITVILFSVLRNYSKGHQIIPEVYPENIIIKNLTFFQHLLWSIKHTYKEVIPWYWGVFRWLSVTLPRIINQIINRSVIFLIIGTVLYFIKVFKKRIYLFEKISLSFFVYISLIYFLIITYWDYLFIITHGFSFGIQGRYFFPDIVPHIGILLFGIIGFFKSNKFQMIIGSVISFGMIIIHEITLFRILFSYFSTESISKFFIQASQYKPWFFKSPVLEFIMLIHLITLSLLMSKSIIKVIYYEKNKL